MRLRQQLTLQFAKRRVDRQLAIGREFFPVFLILCGYVQLDNAHKFEIVPRVEFHEASFSRSAGEACLAKIFLESCSHSRYKLLLRQQVTTIEINQLDLDAAHVLELARALAPHDVGKIQVTVQNAGGVHQADDAIQLSLEGRKQRLIGRPIRAADSEAMNGPIVEHEFAGGRARRRCRAG